MKKKTSKINKYDPIYIKWLDSCTNRGWNLLSEIKTENQDYLTQTSVGFFIKKGKQVTIIVQSLQQYISPNGDRMCHALMEIPNKAILEIKRLF
jgi:hypothetical protein